MSVLGPGQVAIAAPARVYTVAGDGSFVIGALPSVSGRVATEVQFHNSDVALSGDGTLLLCDGTRVWTVGRDGRLRPAAGNGDVLGPQIASNVGDGGPATHAFLHGPSSVASLPDGGFLIADGSRVRRVLPDRTIQTVAGNGQDASTGDGGPAVDASLKGASAVGVTPDGGFLILEANKVRAVSPDGMIRTVAGNGTAGFSGDGGPATGAQINAGGTTTIGFPSGDVAALADGGFLIADAQNQRIRRVSGDGVITTVAGDGRERSSAGDGGPAIQAAVNDPLAVAALPAGGFLIGELGGNRIRQVDVAGVITTMAGTGVDGPLGRGAGVGDGGPPDRAVIGGVEGLGLTPGGDVLVSEFSRVRLITTGDRPFPAIAPTGVGPSRSGPVVGLASTVAGTVVVCARTATRHIVAARTIRLSAGAHSINLGKRLPGGVYDLSIGLRSPRGQRLLSTSLVIGATLPMVAARNATANELAAANDAFGIPTRVGRCRRMSPSRVDCEGQEPSNVGLPPNEGWQCLHMDAVFMRRGFASVRQYECAPPGERRFLARPAWLTESTPESITA